MKRKNLMFVETPVEGEPGAGAPVVSSDSGADGEGTVPAVEQPAVEDGSGKVSDLPEWAQAHIADLRSENAARRTAAKELEQRLADADPEKAAEIIAEAQAATAAVQRELDVVKAARDAGLTGPLVSRLQGNTYEELLADAQSLVAAVKPPAVGGTGGINPDLGDKSSKFDPVAQAAKVRRKR